MPIIIDEVIISVEVGNQAPAATGAGGNGDAVQDKQALVAECVERVLEVLRREQEP